MSAVTELARLPEVVVLAAGVAHTDQSARRAIASFGYSFQVIDLMQDFGYLLHTGSEWRLDPTLREAAIDLATQDTSIVWKEAHEYFFTASQAESSFNEPAYLALGPGYAYHGTEVDKERGLDGYRRCAHVDSLAINLESLALADEQVKRGAIDGQRPEIRFLRAMGLYRSGESQEAIKLLRVLGNSQEKNREVAISQHLVAHWDCQRGTSQAKAAPQLFKRSLRNWEDIQHQAHVKHSMALCLIKQHPGKYPQVISLLEESLNLLKISNDDWGRAKVMHSLGQVLGKRPQTSKKSLTYLKESRDIGVRLRYLTHVKAVETSIAEVSSRADRKTTRVQALQTQRKHRR